MGEVSNVAKYSAEVIGTYILVFSVGCNVLVDNKAFGALSIAATLMVMIYAFAKVSGAHFNPAVSFAVALTKQDFSWGDCFCYIACQLVGALAAAGSYTLVFGKTFQVAPVHPFTWYECCWVELLYTGFLCFCVLNCAVATRSAGNEYYGLCIGFSVVAGGYATGAVSGGCMNPAIAIAADIVSWGQGFGWSMAFALAQFIGAACAVLCFRVVRPEDYDQRQAGNESLLSKVVAEFIGTFILVFTVGLNVCASVTPNLSHCALSIAAALMCSVYCLGDVSGAHFNPAVTAAVFASGRNKISLSDSIYYMISQVAAALLAGFAFGMTTEALGSGFDIGPAGKFTWWNVFFGEFVFTLVLAYVVLSVATTKNPMRDLFGMAIGFSVICGAYAIGPVSGGHLNPAISMGASFANLLFRHGNFWRCLVYTAAQLCGGVAAAGMFSVSHADEFTNKSELPAAK